MPPGTTMNIAANATGLSASNAGHILGDGVSLNLAGADATAALAQLGGVIHVNNSVIRTTSTAGNANGQFGLLATGTGSGINGTGTTITMAPGGNAAPGNLKGVSAEAGGTINLTNAQIQVRGGTNATNNYGAQAIGGGSSVTLTGGSVDASSRGAFGVAALEGGLVDLDGTQITSTGAQNLTTLDYAHAIVARGITSRATGTNVTATALSNFGNGLRVDDGASAEFSSSTLRSNGSGNIGVPAAAVRVTGGGTLTLNDGSSIFAAGLNGSPGLVVDGSGSVASLENASVTVSGLRSVGVYVQAGASASLVDTDVAASYINATGSQQAAVQAEGPGSIIDIERGAISTTNPTSSGVRSFGGATVTLHSTTITTLGKDAAGIEAGLATIDASNLTIVTRGADNAMGALADLGGLVNLTGGSITTYGNQVRQASFAHALGARNPGGTLNAQGTTAQTFGTYAMGVWADDGGTATVNDVTVTTAGNGAIGVFAVTEQTGAQFPATVVYNRGGVVTSVALAHGASAQARNDISTELAKITLTGTPVTTFGEDAVGLRAVLADYGTRPGTGRGEAQVYANNLTVTTSGPGAHGALSRDSPTLVQMDNVALRPTGAAAHGAVSVTGGRIVGKATTAAPSGVEGMALFVVGTPMAVSQADFSASGLTSSNGPTVGVAGNGRIGLINTTVTGTDQWLRVGELSDFPLLAVGEPGIRGPSDFPDDDGNLPMAPPPLPPGAPVPTLPGAANITATGSTLTGSAVTADGSVSNLILVETLWRMTGTSNLTTLVNDPSRIEFAPPVGDPSLAASYKTLTVSNYSGDGTLALNTWLASDGAPSDQLVVVNGSSSGPGFIEVSNTGGRGDLTVADGIRVVQTINATSTANNFALAAPVVAGPYEYFLYRGGAAAVSTANVENSWYLRSEIDCSVPGGPSPPCPAPPPPPPPTPTPPPPQPPGPRPIPAIRQEVSLIAAAPAMAQIYGRTIIDTLHERVGDEELLRQRDDLDSDRRGVNGAWMRYIGHDGEHDGGRLGVYGDRGPNFDYRFDALQIGLDLYRHIDGDDGSRKHAGFYLAYGKGKGEVRHNFMDYRFHAGGDAFKAGSIGGYWTAFNDKGAYLDAIGQYTWYDLRMQSLRMADHFVDADGLALSLEGGWPFILNDGDGRSVEDGRWRLEPQGQVIWQRIDVDDLDDGIARVRFTNGDSLAARLGARLNRNGQREANNGQLRSSNAWLRANIWHEFRGEPRAEFATNSGYLPFAVDLGGSWAEVGIGGTWQVSQTGYLFTDIDYSWSFDGDETSWNGKLGMRWNW